MQEENEDRESFVSRTNALVKYYGFDVGDLAERLGVSRATIFRYRAGKTSPPTRVLKKLAAIEREAGLTAPIDLLIAGAKTSQEISSIMNAATLAERLSAYDLGSTLWNQEFEGAVFEVDLNLASFLMSVRELARLITLPADETDGTALAAEIRALSKKVDWQARKLSDLREDFFELLFDTALRLGRSEITESQ